MKTNLNDKHAEQMEKQVFENKRGIKLLTDINGELASKKNLQSKLKTLQRDCEELEKELRETQQKVNNAWYEKIHAEQTKTNSLEQEWKQLISEIQANSNTPGYQQAIKHTDFQGGVRGKQDVPSTRTNYKNMAARLQNEIKTLQNRVNATRLDLINEIKKKTALEEEVRELRASMSQHRRSVTPSKFTSSVPDLNLHAPTTTRVN